MSRTPEAPPQAPQTSAWRRVLGPLYFTGVFWFRIHRWAVRVLPEWAIAGAIRVFTLVFFVVLRRIRAAVAANLVAVLGPCGWLERQRRIYRTLWRFGWCLSERYESFATERRVESEIENEAAWDELAGGAPGFIVVTAHIGHWEIGSVVARRMRGRKVHMVREPETDPRAQRFVESMLAASDDYEVHFAAGDPRLGARLLTALRDGELVALQGDRPRAGGRTAHVRLFARPFELPVGPAALARAAAVPLLPVFVFRSDRLRAQIVFRSPIEVERTADRGRDLQRAAERLAADLEWAIRREPHQWFVFRELWPPETG